MANRKQKRTAKPSKKVATKRASKPAIAKAAAKKTKRAVKTAKKSAAIKKVTTAAKAGSLSIFDLNGKSSDTLQLDAIFQGEQANRDVIYQTVLMYQAGQREGTAATKDRGHVSGGGKKPWKQKGTGQARHGSRRSPIWRHGGVTFGPLARDYSYSLPLQIRRKAVIEGVKDKIANNRLLIVKDLILDSPKTKLVAKFMTALKLQKPLLLVDKKTSNLVLASRNIRSVAIKTAEEVNVLDVVSHQECVMTKAAYTGLVKRLKS